MTPPAIQVPPRKVLSLKLRVKAFYRDNPGEELTHQQFRDKFSCSKWTAVWIIRTLIEEGLLESPHVIRLRSEGIAKEVV